MGVGKGAKQDAAPESKGTNYSASCYRETGGRRCGLPATAGDVVDYGGGSKAFRGLCTWHHACGSDYKTAQDEEAFRLWLDARSTCGWWVHYSEPYLWSLALGHRTAPEWPRPCARSKCPIMALPATPPVTDQPKLETERPF